MAGPLDGLRVLDLTRYQQGPYATSLLADLGAEVIKIEPRPDGEWGRLTEREADGYSPYFETYNRGKKSLTLDIRAEAGRAVIERLLPDIDILVENFRPGYLDGIGLGYEDLRAKNDRLIYASASAFGSEGPLATRPGYDHIAQAVSGLMVEQAGGPGSEPVPALPGATDQFSAVMFALGIVSAVVARERTGRGQHVDVSLLGSTLALQGRQVARFLKSGKQGRKRIRRSALYSHYKTSDGWVAIAAHNPRTWGPLCTALGEPRLDDDERFADPWERHRNGDELEELLELRFAMRTNAEWLDTLVRNEVPCGAVNDYSTLFSDDALAEQMDANGYIAAVEHATFGTLRVVGSAMRFSDTPIVELGRAPELGEHSELILEEAQYSWEEIERLRRDDVI